jgi:ATP-dependent Clp protease ATP-binding subunit ClpC
MDDGRLTDGEGRTVDFSNTVVVMTSNLGAGAAKRGVGFTAQGGSPAGDAARMEAAAKAAFLPEFLNRIDEIVTFQPLGAEQVERIAGQMVARIAERLRGERGIELELEPELVARLAADGFDAELGARPLRRHLRRTLEKELTAALLDGRLNDGDRAVARVAGDGGITLESAALAPAVA